MTPDASDRIQATPPQAQPRPRPRILARGQAHDGLVRLCEAVLWSIARRRMP